MLASDIISRVRILLNDQDAVRWLDTELIQWVTDAQTMVALVRPDSSIATQPITLVSGTRQAIPADGLRLLDIVRNLNLDGTGNRSVRLVDRNVLDSQDPLWHTNTQVPVIKNWIYDNRDPKTFYVYPPASSAAKLEIMYSKTPTAPTALSSTLSISDIYIDALVNYVMYRAYSKDAEYANNMNLAGTYLQILNAMLGLKTEKDVGFSPDMNAPGGRPMTDAYKAGGV